MTSALYKPLSLSVRFLLLPSVAFWGGLLFHLISFRKKGIGDTRVNPCGYYFHLAAVYLYIENTK